MTDLILDNVTTLQTSEEKFLITIFTIDGQIKQIEFNNLNNSYQISSGSFNLNLNIITIEYLNFPGSNYYTLGSLDGKIHIIKLTILKGVLNFELIDEIKKLNQNLISSYIPINFFQTQSLPDPINSIKYIGNNLIAYVTEQFQFKIYNFNLRKEIYQNCLIKNRNNEILENSKINFQTLNFESNKCFLFTVYFEYNNLVHVIQTFEIWFKNIPQIEEKNFTKHLIQNSLTIPNLDYFYETIELGTETEMKNTRVYKLNGKIVDIINYDKKIWVLSQNPGYLNKISEYENHLEKYELKIFSFNNLEISKLESFSRPEESLIFIDSQFKNAMNILNQIKSYKNYSVQLQMSNINSIFKKDLFNDKITKETQLLFSLLTNEEYIPEVNLINYFNKLYSQNQNILINHFNNKSQVLNHIEKIYTQANFDFNKFLSDSIENIIKDHFNNNEIISLGSFSTLDIEGMALIRKSGISIVKKLSDFQRINNIISKHEYFFRNLIFDSKNVIKYQTHNNLYLKELQSKIYKYITLESKRSQENITYIILAMLRIYLTESNLINSNENLIFNYFNQTQTNLENFLKFNFSNNLTTQFNNLLFLDIFHQIIYNLFLNYKTFIEEHLGIILDKYETYKIDRRDRSVEMARLNENRNLLNGIKNEKFNSKFVELVADLINDKINSFFNISKDLISLKSWTKQYLRNENKFTNILDDRINKIFVESFSLFILSNHKCKLNIKESQVIDNVCLVDYKESQILNNPNDLEISFIQLILYENLYNFGAKIFQEIHNEYFDYIILTIWPDLQFENDTEKLDQNKNNLETYTNYIINDSNRKRRYDLYEKLFKMREFKLISILLKIQNESNLENILIDILCQINLNDSEMMKDLMNKYFSLIMDISNRTDTTGAKEFLLFEEFYHTFSKKEIFNKSPEFLKINHKNRFNLDENLMMIIGYCYLEEQVKNILNDELKYEFYFNCYTFIYPTLINLDFKLIKLDEAKNNKNNENIFIKKVEDFLINMLKSCIEIDIDSALSFYLTTKENFKIIKSIDEIIEIFVDFIIHNYYKNKTQNFISKIIQCENELTNKICENLKQKCGKIKDNNTRMINVLKSHLNLEIDSILLNENNSVNLINSVFNENDNVTKSNVFLILNDIFLQIKDYENAAIISYQYSESIKNVIENYHFNLSDMDKLYTERLKSISKVLDYIQLIELSQSSTNFLINENSNDKINLRFIEKEELYRDKVLVSLRLNLIDYVQILMQNKNQIQNFRILFSNEELNKIKNVNYLLNFIFNLNLYDLILDYELISRNILDEETTKKLIINFIKTNINFENVDFNQFRDDDEAIYNRLNGLVENDKILEKFYDEVLRSENTEYLLITLECLLFNLPKRGLPENLVNFTMEKNSQRLAEMFIKYSRFDDFVNLLVFVINNENTYQISIPHYLIEIASQGLKFMNLRNQEIINKLIRILNLN